MTRTEFYAHLAREGRGQFAVKADGTLRTTEGWDPLSFVAWKLKGLEAKGEVNRPGLALEIKNPMRLVLAQDLRRGYVGSTRRALLTALALTDLSEMDREVITSKGALPRGQEFEHTDPDNPHIRGARIELTAEEREEILGAEEGDVPAEWRGLPPILAAPRPAPRRRPCNRCGVREARPGWNRCRPCQEAMMAAEDEATAHRRRVQLAASMERRVGADPASTEAFFRTLVASEGRQVLPEEAIQVVEPPPTPPEEEPPF
jgi:hypothetical protein